MKTRSIILAALTLTSVFVGFALKSRADEAGKVLAVKNRAYVERESQRLDARPQSGLLLKDAVLTDAGSRTKLFFRDDSILSLGELSRLEVEQYLHNAEKDRSASIYRLLEGSLKVVVGRSDLEIHTPTAVAAARGTKFIVWVEGKPEPQWTGVLVLEGEVVVTGLQAEARKAETVRAGQMTRVPAGGPPLLPEPIDPQVSDWYSRDTRTLGSPFTETRDRLTLAGLTEGGDAAVFHAIRSSLGVLQTPPIEQEPVGAFTPVTVHIEFP